LAIWVTRDTPSPAVRGAYRHGQQFTLFVGPLLANQPGTRNPNTRHRVCGVVYALDITLAAAFVGHVFFCGAFSTNVEDDEELETSADFPVNPA